MNLISLNLEMTIASAIVKKLQDCSLEKASGFNIQVMNSFMYS